MAPGDPPSLGAAEVVADALGADEDTAGSSVDADADVSTADGVVEAVDPPEEQAVRASRVAASARAGLAGIRDHFRFEGTLRPEE